jgi:hypothetical protein
MMLAAEAEAAVAAAAAVAEAALGAAAAEAEAEAEAAPPSAEEAAAAAAELKSLDKHHNLQEKYRLERFAACHAAERAAAATAAASAAAARTLALNAYAGTAPLRGGLSNRLGTNQCFVNAYVQAFPAVAIDKLRNSVTGSPCRVAQVLNSVDPLRKDILASTRTAEQGAPFTAGLRGVSYLVNTMRCWSCGTPLFNGAVLLLLAAFF